MFLYSNSRRPVIRQCFFLCIKKEIIYVSLKKKRKNPVKRIPNEVKLPVGPTSFSLHQPPPSRVVMESCKGENKTFF